MGAWRSRTRSACVAAIARRVAAWGVLLLAVPALAGDPSDPRGPRAVGVQPPVRDLRDAVSGGLPAPGRVAYLGVQFETTGSGLRVGRVVPGSAASAAGLRAGDDLVAIGGRRLESGADFERELSARVPGERVAVEVRRGAVPLTVAAHLGARRPRDGFFRGSVFRLAVVPLRFADGGEPIEDVGRLRATLFARTGQAGRGASLADYYAHQSWGRLAVEGAVLPTVTLRHARSHYAERPMGAVDGSAFSEAATTLAAAGRSALEGFDGVVFLHGGAAERRAGFALWPHRASVQIGDRRLPYYVHTAEGPEAAAIGVHCHEFGHLLGLPDTYGAAHRTGSGDFCLMSIGHRGGGHDGARSPFSLCAWCRTQLAWAEPEIVDPRVPQRLRVRPADSSGTAFAVVPLNARSDEYLLLEVRSRRGFDAALPSEGLLVWRVGSRATPGQGMYGSYVDLVEAHGIDVVDASLVRPEEIAFPTARVRDLTPDTLPHSRPTLRAGFDVHLTDIERDHDGSVLVTVGVAKRVLQAAPAAPAGGGPDADGYVVRTDPITGEDTRLFVGPLDAPPAPPVPETSGTGQQLRR